MAQNIDLSATTLQQAKTALAFTDGYEKTANATNPLVAQIALLQTNLSVYSELLQHLSVAYAALGALASYDASASFNTAASRLSSSVDAFSQSVGSTQPPLHTNLSTLVDAAGDTILSSYQAGRVRAASDALLVQLNRVIAILNTDDVRQKIVPSAALVAGDIDAAALILYGSGAYSYAPLANQIGAPLGLTATASFDATVAKSPKLSAAFRKAELAATETQVAAIGSSLDASEKLLEALRPLHAAIDAGIAVDMTTVDQLVGQLQTLASAIQPLKTSSPGTD